MIFQFQKHYTRDEVRALLPRVRQWLQRLDVLRKHLQKQDRQLTAMSQPGADAGGALVNQWVKTLAKLKETLEEFHQRDIQIKDLDRGLLDFPAIISGREVFLCWERAETDVEFWHELDAGYAGRERLEGPE